MSKQWLNRGQGKRIRDYQPVPVSITLDLPEHALGMGLNVWTALSCRKENDEYQIVALSKAEVESIVIQLIANLVPSDREKLLIQLLRKLPDEAFLRTLAADLRERVRPVRETGEKREG